MDDQDKKDAPSDNTSAAPDLTSDIPPEQVDKLSNDAITSSKEFAMRGTKTHKDPESEAGVEKAGYEWWENQASFEGSTWSVSFWDFDNDTWQIQVTKVELHPDGRSVMTSYSIRDKNDPNFPGFQVYKEQSDDRYKKAAIDDIVYLNRVIEGMLSAATAAS